MSKAWGLEDSCALSSQDANPVARIFLDSGSLLTNQF